jgi:hypothetical protein
MTSTGDVRAVAELRADETLQGTALPDLSTGC